MINLLIRIPHLRGRIDILKFVGKLFPRTLPWAVESSQLHFMTAKGWRGTMEVLVDERTEVMNNKAQRVAAAAAMTRAWAPPYSEWTTHVLVLEDDAVIPPDALEAVFEILKAWPLSPINFFCAREFAKKAHLAGCQYALTEQFSGGVAQCLPVQWATDFSEYHQATCVTDQSIDSRLNQWIFRERRNGNDLKIVVPAPSVFDHDGSLVSMAGGIPHIYAGLAFGPDRSAMLHQNWQDTRALELPAAEGGQLSRVPSWRAT